MTMDSCTVFRAGETFPHDPAITEEEARLSWVKLSQALMVAAYAAGSLVGTYFSGPTPWPSAPTWPTPATWWLGFIDALVMIQSLMEEAV